MQYKRYALHEIGVYRTDCMRHGWVFTIVLLISRSMQIIQHYVHTILKKHVAYIEIYFPRNVVCTIECPKISNVQKYWCIWFFTLCVMPIVACTKIINQDNKW